MSETEHAKSRGWGLNLNVCLHIAMAAGASLIGQAVDDFNSFVFLMTAAAALILPVFVELIESNQASAREAITMLVKLGKFFVAAAFACAVLALLRWKLGI